MVARLVYINFGDREVYDVALNNVDFWLLHAEFVRCDHIFHRVFWTYTFIWNKGRSERERLQMYATGGWFKSQGDMTSEQWAWSVRGPTQRYAKEIGSPRRPSSRFYVCTESSANAFKVPSTTQEIRLIMSTASGWLLRLGHDLSRNS